MRSVGINNLSTQLSPGNLVHIQTALGDVPNKAISCSVERTIKCFREPAADFLFSNEDLNFCRIQEDQITPVSTTCSILQICAARFHA